MKRRLGGLHLCLRILVDVGIDPRAVLVHSGVDAREAIGITAAGSHDAHLHQGIVFLTHQRAAIIPLWKHTHNVNLVLDYH